MFPDSKTTQVSGALTWDAGERVRSLFRSRQRRDLSTGLHVPAEDMPSNPGILDILESVELSAPLFLPPPHFPTSEYLGLS